MSDYAGPILGAVGAVVGFVATGYNPQGAYWGWAIGSTLGGMYSASQQVLPGPKIGDVQKQTSQEGGFRAIIFGRSHPITGNVIADSEPVIVRKEESQGKGGPKVETEYAYRTYAVGFCEGETTLLQAWRNGILVYDVEDPAMAPENAKFLEYATWYTGSFDQMPDPDLQAIYGVNNTPFFRGTSYLVLASEDVTDQRGAWSQWQVRVFRGASKRVTSPVYVLEYQDGDITAGPAVPAMLLRTTRKEGFESEELQVSPSLVGITLRNNRTEIGSSAEHLAIAPSLPAITLRNALMQMDVPTEQIAITTSIQAMTLKDVRLDLEPPTEHVQVTPSLPGISLYVP